jgi:two-component system NtrC family sensor kinase
MRFDLSFSRLSLKTKLISVYLVILGIGGLATSLVGSWIVSSTIMTQARRSVDGDLATARLVYDQQLETLKQTVQLATSGTTIQRYLSASDQASLMAYLDAVRKGSHFDFLTLTDGKGRVALRASDPDHLRDDVSSISVVRAALAGNVAASTEIFSAELLDNENPVLRERAYFHLVPTPRAKPADQAEEASGMVLIAAAPLHGVHGEVLGALYGGVLLNRNFGIVDRVSDLVSRGELFKNKDVGTVTIFQHDVRISTTVKGADGQRALGTRVSEEVNDVVLGRGEIWRAPAFVVDDWYISAYEPIRNYDRKIVGMLYVGLLESAYISVRNRVIFSFFAIAILGFILIIGITYYEIGKITFPLGKMAAATRSIAAGRFDQEVPTGSQGEIAQLADSFNTMLQSLRQMKGDLEEWGRTLEQKVEQRTEELSKMQARVAQSERLASLGLLAAGVAHEINNPLGGILALTALTLEDVKADDPNRENLEVVVKQAQRCRDIVKGLLEFSRHSEANPELADLNRILQDTLALVAKQAQFLNVNVVRNWDPQLPPVMGDKSQLEQVFTNMLVNAAQAMEEKGTITLTTRYNPGDKSVEVLISDTGHGIPPEKLPHIFDPFFTTKGSGQGTGLGLSIAYGIITSHQGSISVESEVGRGSTFKISLPAALAVPQDNPRKIPLSHF